MNKEADPGLEALRRIAGLWRVDADRVIWGERGFDWWPGSFKVAVMAIPVTEDQEQEEGPAWRLSVRTAVLKEVPTGATETQIRIASFAAFSPTYGMIYPPAGLSQQHPTLADGTLWLQSTAYLRSDSVGWLPEFLARMAILQPIDAQRHAENLAAMLGGTPDVSAPQPGSATDHRDEMLTLADAFYVPIGKEANRWAGTAEFEECAERFGRNDNCFGVGDPTGVSLETPFGNNSALIRLWTKESHPHLGTGLLASIQMPVWRNEPEAVNECAWFNYFEAMSWTGFPQLGSWAPKQSGEHWGPAMAYLVPNALYAPGVATNVALWQIARARWIKQKFFADRQDRPMKDILLQRWQRPSPSVPG